MSQVVDVGSRGGPEGNTKSRVRNKWSSVTDMEYTYNQIIKVLSRGWPLPMGYWCKSSGATGCTSVPSDGRPTWCVPSGYPRGWCFIDSTLNRHQPHSHEKTALTRSTSAPDRTPPSIIISILLNRSGRYVLTS